MSEGGARNVQAEPAAIGNAGPFTVVMDRPADGGGRGVGFNGGQLLYLAVAGCVAHDLFREAGAGGIPLDRVRVTTRGGFRGRPPGSAAVRYQIQPSGD